MDINGHLTIKELKGIFQEINQKNFLIDEKNIEVDHPIANEESFEGRIIINKKISSSDLKWQKVSGVQFYGCKFIDCDLTGSLFFVTAFEQCTFENTKLDRCVFRKCKIDNCQFVKCDSRYNFHISESYIYDTDFFSCYFIGIEISESETSNTYFQDTSLISGRYMSNYTNRTLLSFFPKENLDKDELQFLSDKEIYDDLIFANCTFEFTLFKMMNFMDTKFQGCEIAKCDITESKMYNYNFDSSNNTKGWGKNTIDLETLSKSELLSASVLKSMFNIEEDVQIEIQKQLNTKIMSSVFISYSLRDAKIANAINEFLKSNNVSTFLWEKDAPGGKPLKSIMKSNINSKDRLLFIASENSLKSEACHYELTTGRKKQDKLWKTILFPIHIDNFLFEIEKDVIRPKSKRDEFWENIEELKEINSLDFTEFKNGVGRKKQQFKVKMDHLLKSLKLN